MRTDEKEFLQLRILRLQEKILQAKQGLNCYKQGLLIKSLTTREIVDQLHLHCGAFAIILQEMREFLSTDCCNFVDCSRYRKNIEWVSQHFGKSSLLEMANHFKQLCEQTEFKKMQSRSIQITLQQIGSAIGHAQEVSGQLNFSFIDKFLMAEMQMLRVELVSGLESLRIFHLKSETTLSEYAKKQLPDDMTLQQHDENCLKPIEQPLNTNNSCSVLSFASRFLS